MSRLDELKTQLDQAVEDDESPACLQAICADMLEKTGIHEIRLYLEAARYRTAAYAALFERIDEPADGDPDILDTLDTVIQATPKPDDDHLFAFDDPIQHLYWHKRQDPHCRQYPAPLGTLYQRKGDELAKRGLWKLALGAYENAMRWNPANARLCARRAQLYEFDDEEMFLKLVRAALYDAYEPADFAYIYRCLMKHYSDDPSIAVCFGVLAVMWNGSEGLFAEISQLGVALPSPKKLESALALKELPCWLSPEKVQAFEQLRDEYPELEEAFSHILDGFSGMVDREKLNL